MSSEKQHNIFVDAFAFMLNVASSVLIIFVNKQLMRPPEAGGAGFNFCTSFSCVLRSGGSASKLMSMHHITHSGDALRVSLHWLLVLHVDSAGNGQGKACGCATARCGR